MSSRTKVTEIYCIADEFCKEFAIFPHHDTSTACFLETRLHLATTAPHMEEVLPCNWAKSN